MPKHTDSVHKRSQREQRRRQGLICGYAKCEAQRAKSGWRVLGERKVNSVPPAMVSNLVHFGPFSEFKNRIKMMNRAKLQMSFLSTEFN